MGNLSAVVAVALIAGALVTGCSSSNPSEWKKREKGAAIGGLGGAALGGIVGSQSDDTATGALLGGAAGAGAGYLIGRETEDDEDEYERRQRERYERERLRERDRRYYDDYDRRR
ncbi:MAG: hypothetical protein J5J00_11755 [Deltaproteobacteria bacterium]|nr:hypothetical protein [Deltaproteobacteria bacterium]